jgi:DUF4097 and DUF4098 domain-containing protein YvlB
MLWTLATLAGLALAQQTDTTVAVESGTRLRVDAYGGAVQIRAGTDNRVRVRAEHQSRDRVELVRQGGTLTVKSESRRGMPMSVDFTITVPKWMPVAVSGVYIDADIAGTEGDVAVETVQGEVSLTGGNGFISLQSVEGTVTLRGARGRIRATSVNEGIEAYDAVGDLEIETVNGDVTLRGIDGTNVEATTVNGDISYDGTLKDTGRYAFASHNGDITVSVPERANLTVGISTYQGEFDSSFPVTLEGVSPKRRFSFRLGSGSGRLEIESFQGDIRLRRPGEMRTRGNRNDQHDQDHEDYQ